MKPPFHIRADLAPDAAFTEGCRALGLDLTPVQRRRLAGFVSGLATANQTLNLVRFPDPAGLWNRHVLDSLTLVPLLGDASSLLDVGPGGGFPGLVAAIAAPRLQRVALVESTQKKARFLQEACRALSLHHVEVAPARAETLAHQAAYREQFDVVTARAVAALPALLELTVPFARVHGRILALKGTQAEQEIQAAATACRSLHCRLQRRIRPDIFVDSGSCIIEFVKDQSTDTRYPRKPGAPVNRPL